MLYLQLTEPEGIAQPAHLPSIPIATMAVLCSFLQPEFRFQLASTCWAFWFHVAQHLHVAHTSSLNNVTSCQLLVPFPAITLQHPPNDDSTLADCSAGPSPAPAEGG